MNINNMVGAVVADYADPHPMVYSIFQNTENIIGVIELFFEAKVCLGFTGMTMDSIGKRMMARGAEENKD